MDFGVWIGLFTDGEPSSLNGEPFEFRKDHPRVNLKEVFAVEDLIGYPTGRTFLIIEVESDLIRMSGPITEPEPQGEEGAQ